MRKCAEEFRQKKMTMNMGYSIMNTPRENQMMGASYIAKTRIDGVPGMTSKIDFTSINPKPDLSSFKVGPEPKYVAPKTEYYPSIQPQSHL